MLNKLFRPTKPMDYSFIKHFSFLAYIWALNPLICELYYSWLVYSLLTVTSHFEMDTKKFEEELWQFWPSVLAFDKLGYKYICLAPLVCRHFSKYTETSVVILIFGSAYMKLRHSKPLCCWVYDFRIRTRRKSYSLH